MYTNELFGREVLDIDANRIGKVVDIKFDLLEGIVNHLIVKVIEVWCRSSYLRLTLNQGQL